VEDYLSLIDRLSWVRKPINNSQIDITSFTASPATITAGQSSTLTWVANAPCGITQGSVATIDNWKNAGTLVVTPGTTWTYELKCTIGQGGGDYKTRNVTVTVGTGSGPNISSFTANPTSITPGQSSTLTWVAEATSCELYDSVSGLSSQPATGSKNVSPRINTPYTLTCIKNGQTTSKSVTVNSSALGDVWADTVTSPNITVDVKANGSNGTNNTVLVPQRTNITLSWESTNASSCSQQLTAAGGAYPSALSSLKGSLFIQNAIVENRLSDGSEIGSWYAPSPQTPLVYTMTCTGVYQGKTISASDSITVRLQQ
jgi:hypothetical protein